MLWICFHSSAWADKSTNKQHLVGSMLSPRPLLPHTASAINKRF